MIYEGSEGSICGYYKNELICSVPWTKHKDLEYYTKIANSVTIQALQKHSIPNQIRLWNDAMEKMLFYKKNCQSRCSDRELNKYCITGMLCLIKFKVINPDSETEGLFITPKYKKNNTVKKNINYTPRCLR